jgi:hypothetical protein
VVARVGRPTRRWKGGVDGVRARGGAAHAGGGSERQLELGVERGAGGLHTG